MSQLVGQQQPVGPDHRPAQPAVLRLWDRWSVFTPFAVAGSVSVIAGGLLAAAIAAPAPTRHGVWATAYLVLVLGVGQLVLGAGQALLAATPPTGRIVSVTAALFNTANAAILVGIITDRMVVFDVGAVLLIGSLALFLHGVRHGARAGWALHGYRFLIAALIVSIPIGMFLNTVGPA